MTIKVHRTHLHNGTCRLGPAESLLPFQSHFNLTQNKLAHISLEVLASFAAIVANVLQGEEVTHVRDIVYFCFREGLTAGLELTM